MLPLVQLQNISKSYGGVQALCDVSLEIRSGEIHALCGENGAGKSTLIKILTGSVKPDAGQVLISPLSRERSERLAPLLPGSVAASENAGIAVIHQESVAFSHLSTFDNIFIGREPRRFGGVLLDRPKMRQQTKELLARLGESFDPTCPLAELSVAQRQMVGIARAISRDCRLLIMDEPTASLSARETEVLFRIIRQLQAQSVAILYVSHRLDEVFALSNRTTVLRDGRFVATHETRDLSRDKLIQLMVGRELLETDARPAAETTSGSATAAPLLEVRNLAKAGVFRDVSFQIRPGEIVGLSGLVGAGRSEVARAVFGADEYDSGSVLVAGQTLPPHDIRVAMRGGIALVPEDRQHLGLVLPMTVGANLSMAVLRSLTSAGLTSGAKERPLVRQLMKDLAVKASTPGVPASTLSGGNQQKLVLGKWLATKPRILILDEPTRGVDVGAKAEVHRLIRQLASQGIATLVISSDLPEILALSHRILVMRGGAIAGEVSGATATQQQVLALAIPGGVAA